MGCWFVPVVNYWMPYQAIRDCLPPGDPSRRLVKVFWGCFIGVELVFPAAFVAGLFSSSASLALSVPGLLLGLGLISTGAPLRRRHRRVTPGSGDPPGLTNPREG